MECGQYRGQRNVYCTDEAVVVGGQFIWVVARVCSDGPSALCGLVVV